MNPGFPEVTVLVGSGRSGTSYLKDVLMRTVSVGFPPEPKFIPKLYARLDRFGDLSRESNLRRLVDEMLRTPFFDDVKRWRGYDTTAEDILSRVEERSYRGVLYGLFRFIADQHECTRLGYKDPQDVVHMKLIAELLPTARFVHIIRDGRDVSMSFIRKYYGPTNFYSASSFWSRRTDIGRRDGRELGDRYHELRFEDLILDPESVAAPLVDFIVRGRDERATAAFLDELEATRRPNAVYRWKQALGHRDRWLCEAGGGRTLEACGYETEFENPRVNPVQRAFYRSSDVAVRGFKRVIREARQSLTGWHPEEATA